MKGVEAKENNLGSRILLNSEPAALALLPSLQRLDALASVDHVAEITPVAAVVGARMSAPGGLLPH